MFKHVFRPCTFGVVLFVMRLTAEQLLSQAPLFLEARHVCVKHSVTVEVIPVRFAAVAFGDTYDSTTAEIFEFKAPWDA